VQPISSANVAQIRAAAIALRAFAGAIDESERPRLGSKGLGPRPIASPIHTVFQCEFSAAVWHFDNVLSDRARIWNALGIHTRSRAFFLGATTNSATFTRYRF